MKPGTKPKPTALKLLRGVENKDRINQNEPKPEKKLLKCPYYIKKDKIVRQEWDRIVPVLYLLNLLTVADRAALELYCTQYSIYREAIANIKEDWLTTFNVRNGIKPNPSISIEREAAKIIKAIAVEFVLTPSSRGRISVSNENEDDPMEDLLKSDMQR